MDPHFHQGEEKSVEAMDRVGDLDYLADTNTLPLSVKLWAKVHQTFRAKLHHESATME
jgi:hypothetical protein